MNQLPNDVMHIIAKKVVEPWMGYKNSAFHDGATHAACAASCIVASKTTKVIGDMIYSILLNNISHLEKLPPLPSEKSTVKDLKDHLRKMDLKVSGVKTELWDRIKSEYGTKHCPILKKHQHIVKKRASYREYRVNRPDKPYKSIFDLHKEALSKYGGNIEAFNTRVYRQYQEDQRRIRIQMAERSERRNLLEDCARERGCVLCHDKLCVRFIDDGIGDPRKIAIVMEEMQFFYNHTNYATIFNFIKRYEYDWRWFNRDLETIIPRAKSRALECWKKRNTNWKESNILPKSLHDGCGKKC